VAIVETDVSSLAPMCAILFVDDDRVRVVGVADAFDEDKVGKLVNLSELFEGEIRKITGGEDAAELSPPSAGGTDEDLVGVEITLLEKDAECFGVFVVMVAGVLDEGEHDLLFVVEAGGTTCGLLGTDDRRDEEACEDACLGEAARVFVSDDGEGSTECAIGFTEEAFAIPGECGAASEEVRHECVGTGQTRGEIVGGDVGDSMGGLGEIGDESAIGEGEALAGVRVGEEGGIGGDVRT